MYNALIKDYQSCTSFSTSTTNWSSITQLCCALLMSMLLLTPTASWSIDWIPLPDTGQTVCFNTNGSEIACPVPGKPFYGQDAQYQETTPSYQTNGNQTVSDTHTGLMWDNSNMDLQRTWEDAISYCQDLDFAGKTDWRLPNKFELESIVDYGRSYPAMNPVFNYQSSFYWSTTPHMPNPVYAWSVFCPDGADHWVHKSNTYNVRCVRTEI
jgi:Protein of unknown function (DUF1566)